MMMKEHSGVGAIAASALQHVWHQATEATCFETALTLLTPCDACRADGNYGRGQRGSKPALL
jgi:hypothetical protein